MMFISWLKKLVKKTINWIWGKEKEEAVSTFSMSPSSSEPSPEDSIFEATAISREYPRNLEEMAKNLKSQERRIEVALKELERMGTLLFLGFFILLFMLAGLVFGYYRYVLDSVIKDDYKYGFSEKINKQGSEIDALKKENIKLEKIIDCQKNKKYWQYNECF